MGKKRTKLKIASNVCYIIGAIAFFNNLISPGVDVFQARVQSGTIVFFIVCGLVFEVWNYYNSKKQEEIE